jgi:hypothetical protein
MPSPKIGAETFLHAANRLGFRIAVTYISAMPKRTPRIKLFEWRVIKIRSTPAALVGYFAATNADDAIKAAIAERGIGDPLTQSRLAAQRVREIANG